MVINIIRGVQPILKYPNDKASFTAAMMLIGDPDLKILFVADSLKNVGMTNDVNSILSSLLGRDYFKKNNASGFIRVYNPGQSIGNYMFDVVIDAAYDSHWQEDKAVWFDGCVSPHLEPDSHIIIVTN